MLRTYRYKLKPNATQKTFFEKSFGCARFIFNWSLQKRLYSLKNGQYISLSTLSKDLTALKNDYPWLNEVSRQAIERALYNMDVAFRNFYRLKRGCPRFKSKKNPHQAFHYTNGVKIKINFVKRLIYLPKAGWVKFFKNREFLGRISSAVISRNRTGEYYISVLVRDIEDSTYLSPIYPESSVGVDAGVKDFAVLSNGQVFLNPKHLEKAEKRLKVLQKRYSKKQKGSKRQEQARLAIAKAHEKVKNCRLDYIHKVSSKIISENQTIIIEDLNIEGMMKNHKLAKHIASVSWGEFFRQLQYKAEWYGRNLIKIGRFEPSSKMCLCGAINKDLKLSQREWNCPNCGRHNDRDLLAAINIKRFGLQKQNLIGISPAGCGVGDVEWSALADTVKRQYVFV